MSQEIEKPQYFRIKEYDFNDVFDYSKYVYGTYDQVRKYLIGQYADEIKNELDIDESSEDIHIAYYMPVTDEDGNEVDSNDERYDELNESQEARIQLGFSAELTDKQDTENETLIDLTSESVENK